MKPVKISAKQAMTILSETRRLVRIGGYTSGNRTNLTKATNMCIADTREDYWYGFLNKNYFSEVKASFTDDCGVSYEVWFDGSMKIYYISIYGIEYMITTFLGYTNVFRLYKF